MFCAACLGLGWWSGLHGPLLKLEEAFSFFYGFDGEGLCDLDCCPDPVYMVWENWEWALAHSCMCKLI